MDFVVFFCKDCDRETVHDVIDYTDKTETGWFKITIQCSECGKEHTMNVHNC